MKQLCCLKLVRRLGPVAFVLLALILEGCGSSGPANEDIYYRLNLSANAPPIKHQYPGTVLVTRLDGRGFTGDRALIFRDPTKQDQVQRYTYHFWAEAPPIAIQDLLARYLREARIADFVVTPAQRVRSDLTINGTLFRVEHLPFADPPKVLIDMELAVVRLDRREPVFLKRYQSQVITDGRKISNAIPAFDSALEKVFQDFLNDLEAALSQLETSAPQRSH